MLPGIQRVSSAEARSGCISSNPAEGTIPRQRISDPDSRRPVPGGPAWGRPGIYWSASLLMFSASRARDALFACW